MKENGGRGGEGETKAFLYSRETKEEGRRRERERERFVGACVGSVVLKTVGGREVKGIKKRAKEGGMKREEEGVSEET